MNNHGLANALLILAIVIAVAAAVFLICRAFVLWYWRVGEIVDLLAEIRDRLPVPPDDESVPTHRPTSSSAKKFMTCPSCGARQELDEEARFCDQCSAPYG